jgi:hypothetical protein
VYGYAPHCGTSCTPLWVGAASDYIEARPILQGDVVYVATSSGIVGFPLHCQGQCLPTMRADLGRYVSIEVADDDGLVAASHFGRHQGVVVVPADCGDPCAPAWETSSGGDVYGVSADASSVVVGTFSGSIVLYPRRCSDGCAPTQRQSVGGDAWWLFERGGRVIVGARGAGATSTPVTLSVFQIG